MPLFHDLQSRKMNVCDTPAHHDCVKSDNRQTHPYLRTVHVPALGYMQRWQSTSIIMLRTAYTYVAVDSWIVLKASELAAGGRSSTSPELLPSPLTDIIISVSPVVSSLLFHLSETAQSYYYIVQPTRYHFEVKDIWNHHHTLPSGIQVILAALIRWLELPLIRSVCENISL